MDNRNIGLGGGGVRMVKKFKWRGGKRGKKKETLEREKKKIRVREV